jgi:tyrosinase
MSSIRSFLSFTALLALVTTSVASPTTFKRDSTTVKRQNGPSADVPFAVTGVPGDVHPRLEIRDLMTNKDQFNLFILALQNLKQADQSNFLSYFQVAGMIDFDFDFVRSLS